MGLWIRLTGTEKLPQYNREFGLTVLSMKEIMGIWGIHFVSRGLSQEILKPFGWASGKPPRRSINFIAV